MRLVTISGAFTAIDQVVQLDIPNLSSEAALRLHRSPASIDIVMIADPTIRSTHPRFFKMQGNEDLPPDFIKYIGTFPFEGNFGPVPPPDNIVHIIEVSTASALAAGLVMPPVAPAHYEG